MNLLENFQQHWKQNFCQLSPANCQLLLAVSGGVDSVVMTDLIHKTGFDFTIAHCNFKLRAAESERDEAFVKALGEKYNKEVLVKQFYTEEYAAKNKLSIQEAARELRYDFFKDVINDKSLVIKEKRINQLTDKPINYIATAHNADDNIETLLMFFFRGTGIHGLTGIPVIDKERKIIRPLLFAGREEILNYANENNLSWVEDSSNAAEKYTRNFFRNKMIPAIEEHFPNVKNNLLLNINRFAETAELYQQAIALHKKKLLEFKGDEIHIPILKLQKTKPLDAVLWEIIKECNFHSHQIEEVKKLFEASNSSYTRSSTHRIIKNRNWFIIVPNSSEEAQHILIEEENNIINFRRGALIFENISISSLKLQVSNLIAYLDAKHIEFPLLLRKWKQGDYFYPLGMQKKKKLGKFFIDLKLSKTEKENLWVLEMNRRIIWVIGYRIDDRFKITAATKEILKISFTASQER